MERDTSIHDLMARLQAQDDTAARQVFQRYAERLVELARHNLRPRMRAKMDPEDVLQSVFQSFFVRQAAGEFTDVESWESLWKVLVTLTIRKCGRQMDRFRTGRRDVSREVNEPAKPGDGSGDTGWEALLAAPTEVEALLLTETLELVMNHLGGEDRRGERNRQILALRLQGYEVAEISEKLNCTERTVYRVLDRARELLNEMQADEG